MAENLDTKERILIATRELFAEKGFNGTSIRDIASRADVNVAAVNYHFKNKETLYWEIYSTAYDNLETDIRNYAAEFQSLVELGLRLYDRLIDDGANVRNIFKMMLDDSISEPEEKYLEYVKGEKAGPPGEKIFLHRLQQEAKNGVDEKELLLVTRSILIFIMHSSIMCGMKKLKMKRQTDPLFSEASFKEMVRISVESLKKRVTE